jgi:four helix bundle protein
VQRGLRPLASLTWSPRDGVAQRALRAVRNGEPGEMAMLRIYDDMLEAVYSMRGMLAAIEKRDPDLARQLRRAASSVVLNVAEGSGSFGRMRTARYRTALGSARETLACLRVAEAFGYVHTVPAELGTRMNRVIGTLVRVAA